jgi:hypothetical protein
MMLLKLLFVSQQQNLKYKYSIISLQAIVCVPGASSFSSFSLMAVASWHFSSACTEQIITSIIKLQ